MWIRSNPMSASSSAHYTLVPFAVHHRVRAIRGIIESDFQQQVQAAMLRYQELGAPLGLDEDLARFATALSRAQPSSANE